MDQGQFQQIPIEHLRRGKYQPRRDFNPEALQELADSICEQGIIEPIVIRPIDHTHYEIVAGERRWRAAQLAGVHTIPAIVREYSDEQAAEVTLIENIQREDLNPIEEANALQRLLDDFQYTHEEMAIAVGKSRAKVTNCLRLLHLDTRVQHMIINKQLTEGHGKAIASIAMTEQYALANQSVEQQWSVRRVENEVKKVKAQGEGADTSMLDPNVTRLERVATERFGAEVKLENHSSQKSGWIKVKYYDYDTLSGILDKMGIEYEI